VKQWKGQMLISGLAIFTMITMIDFQGGKVMYLIGSIDLLNEKDRKELVRRAGIYDDNEFNRFVAETGWESCMEDFTESADGEEISEYESEMIDDVLNQAWKEAHPEM
jgi:hypothetical protein